MPKNEDIGKRKDSDAYRGSVNTVVTYALLASLRFAVQSALGLDGFDPNGNTFGKPGVNASYDYIVVCGGTGGLAIAARLAEDKIVSVAVVEAGGFYQIDNGNRRHKSGPNHCYVSELKSFERFPWVDRQFATTPQSGLGNRSVHYARGKTLGGSSALNYMAYDRATNGSYGKWAHDVGDLSYTFEQLLPHYERSVNVTFPSNDTRLENATFNFDRGAYNEDAPRAQPLHVSWSGYAGAFSTWFSHAFKALGLRTSNGFDLKSLSGANRALSTIDPDGVKRDLSQTSFLNYAMPDITVYPHTLARKILFGNDSFAEGVALTTSGVNYTLTANEEVILLAGAFHSPQLLMSSGIGPANQLEQHDLPVIKDLPGVGQNMWDQIFFGIAYPVSIPTTARLQTAPEYAAQALEMYKANGTGPLAGAAGMIAFERLTDNIPELISNSTIADLEECFPLDWPDVEYLSTDAWTGMRNENEGPVCRCYGSTHHQSNWLTDPRDKEVAIAAFKRTRQIWDAMSDIVSGEEYRPGPGVQSDEAILDWIQQDSLTIWHASATCKMGTHDDDGAVVDSKARMYGMDKLQVVDASAFPFLPPGHPQSTV
ncbi:GMC oxidoreductase [Hortaea werneckii]|nr:GMC oxidoreductase [Hortaea werneckii]KAI7625623.1 GMC oxidoreductase [Hortaea werneckii]KAI7635518.1 GMC oxidoreductase [Hortaea werneckii]KAI7681533.1 GMC oxidoreductase [Hortaea werneckii]KAI7723455.1 GMC oxidoreductase [Hortaea werneckii]